MSETPAEPVGRKAAFGFIFATSIMNSLSFGIMIPVLPNLIKHLVGGDTATASTWNVLFAVTWGTMQLFCGPILGMLSDRIGRRPVLLISLFGPDNCFGLSWTLLYLIETAPNALTADYSANVDNGWVQLMKRQTVAAEAGTQPCPHDL